MKHLLMMQSAKVLGTSPCDVRIKVRSHEGTYHIHAVAAKVIAPEVDTKKAGDLTVRLISATWELQDFSQIDGFADALELLREKEAREQKAAGLLSEMG